MSAPIIYRWTGLSMEPLARFGKQADQEFVIGETYALVEVLERSSASHRHYFACVNEAWLNLDEEYADRFPTSEHLRKWALIKAGYRDARSTVCGSKAEALRVAAFVKPMDEYAVVVVSGPVVTVYTAKSQSMKAMGKEAFQASKDAVLEIVAGMARTTVPDLARAANNNGRDREAANNPSRTAA